ncbi:hypothetical protein MHYP_G00277980 [Metynnis hypsauchen]
MQPLYFDATDDLREEAAISCSERTGPLPARTCSQSYYLLTQVEGEPEGEDSDGEAKSSLLDRGNMEEDEEDNSTFPAQQSRPPSSTNTGAQADSSLNEVCKHVAAKLAIPWPVAQNAEGAERDLYDGKRLPPAHTPAR